MSWFKRFALRLACLSMGLQATVFATQPLRDEPDAVPGRSSGMPALPVPVTEVFGQPLSSMDDAGRAPFAVGKSFFRRNWVAAPASARARDGLGPLFNAQSCSGCHAQDGRGLTPDRGGLGMVLRLSVPGRGSRGQPLPHPVYGDQLATRALPGVPVEGRLAWQLQRRQVRLADGSTHALRRFAWRIVQPGYGPLRPAGAPPWLSSPRLAPQLAGMGLLQAISEQEIVANAQAQAQRRDAIHGQAQRVWDPVRQAVALGRFGWKAGSASLLQQTAAAFAGDIGVRSRLFPQPACSPVQADCLRLAAQRAGEVDIDDALLAQVVFYQALLAPPPRRLSVATAEDLRRGEALFSRAACDVCHRPRYPARPAPASTQADSAARAAALSDDAAKAAALGDDTAEVAELAAADGAALGYPSLETLRLDVIAAKTIAGQPIEPYTDLLLHDMGPGLADGRPEFQANGRQWRTPPLWGLGWLPLVNGDQRLLHDGRARGVLEAVLWHGGEAQASRDRVRAMSRAERRALVRFVESL